MHAFHESLTFLLSNFAAMLQAPTIRQSDQRHYLILACIHLARELVLNDGLSRLSKQQLASALKWHLDKARQSDSAIRLGGDLGITIGADKHSPNHNIIMYEVRGSYAHFHFLLA